MTGRENTMGDRAQFEQLIRGLMDPSNEARKISEASFEQLCAQPELAAPLLCSTMQMSEDEMVRSLTIIMFRKRVTEQFFQQLSPDTKAGVKHTLISCVQHEPSASNRKKLADTTGEVAAMIFESESESWPELFPFLFESAKNPTAHLRESAMLILSRLAFSASDALKENNSHVKMLCAQTLQDPESKDVRLAALSATGSIVQAFSSYEEQVSDFQDVIPTMCQVLTGLLNENDQDSSRIALEEFISMAEEAPKFFRKHLDSLIQLAFQIATANNLEEDTRFLAVELLVTLAEQAPAMMRKQKVFLDNMIPLALQLMLTVEEVDMHAWNSTTDDDDDTELTSLDVGKDALDRLALSLGGKTVFGLAFRQDLLPSFMHHEDWKYRHAALTCIAQIAEGCQKQMKQHLESIVMQTAQCFSDAHPRVRWAAINAMGQLETDLGPDLQERYHAVVLPALITVMDDNANPRVQSHAAAAVINFTEDCKKDTVQPYLEGLLGKLLHLLMGGVRIVQEQAITAIASVADCVQDQFKPFYGGIMPVLKDILRNCVHKDQRMLRGKAMECISLIGIAVGKEVFIADAKEVIDQFLNTQTAALDPDDPQISYLLQVWGRLAKALKHDFIPYLNVVMPPLLNSAGIKADDQILDDDQEDEEEEGITTVVVQTEEGAKKVALKTAALEEKSTACNMLVCYFAELKEGMFPFLEQVAHLMIPLLAFIYSEEVRTAAASLMPELIDCAISSMRNGLCNQTFVKGLSDMVFQKLVAMIKEEPEPDVQLAMLESLNESMSFGGDGCLGSPDMVVQVLVALHTVLSEVMERCEKRKKARKDEDFDDDDAENQEIEADRDNDLLESISSNIGTLTKHHAEAVHAAFAKYVEVFGTLVSSPMVTHQRIGICIFDELLENLGEHGQTYMPQLLPALLQFSKDRNSEVRQAAVYGLGICAQYGGSVFGQNAGQVLQCIYENLNHPSAREDSNVYATDNAISALGKIIEFQGQNMEDRNGAITRFVHYLPVTGDKEEGVQVHGRLCSMVERGEAALQPLLPKVLVAIVETETVDEEVTGRIRKIFSMFQTTPGVSEVLQQTFASLPPDQQEKINRLMQ